MKSYKSFEIKGFCVNRQFAGTLFYTITISLTTGKSEVVAIALLFLLGVTTGLL